ncbi:hypothetical protein [Deinococcus sp. Leaf326]|uniref:hypothetical protein n=1 Tax=Deinococcus sp. Leaf326 TaxID=1736338 RepID=UPI0006FF97A0|nr:hypothetical protein [Deinococcus sp. Leaf326]KQR28033.1 hypothetical protein ASF71_05520 [Deinococcus sp. Leaf326]
MTSAPLLLTLLGAWTLGSGLAAPAQATPTSANRTGPLQARQALARPAQPGPALSRPADPWPASEVLTRLLVLPAGRADGERLVRELRLSPAQVRELRRLAASEHQYGQAAWRVVGRDNAAALNTRLAGMRAEKDRKVRAALGGTYPAFRAWLRTWWATQVEDSRQNVPESPHWK